MLFILALFLPERVTEMPVVWRRMGRKESRGGSFAAGVRWLCAAAHELDQTVSAILCREYRWWTDANFRLGAASWVWQ
jgi:hypothetical protein